jgi:hypothetical protein
MEKKKVYPPAAAAAGHGINPLKNRKYTSAAPIIIPIIAGPIYIPIIIAFLRKDNLI